MERKSGDRSTLDVGQRLRHFAVTYSDHVYPANISRLASRIYPTIQPADEGTISEREQLFDLEGRVRGGLKERFPGSANSRASFVALSVRRWSGVLEYA